MRQRSKKEGGNLVVDSHPVTIETFGFRVTPFAKAQLHDLAPDVIVCLYADGQTLSDRIKQILPVARCRRQVSWTGMSPFNAKWPRCMRSRREQSCTFWTQGNQVRKYCRISSKFPSCCIQTATDKPGSKSNRSRVTGTVRAGWDWPRRRDTRHSSPSNHRGPRLR